MKTIIVTTHHVAASEMRIKARQASAPNPNAFLSTNPTPGWTIVSTVVQEVVYKSSTTEEFTNQCR
jgi:hypothetical protein